MNNNNYENNYWLKKIIITWISVIKKKLHNTIIIGQYWLDKIIIVYISEIVKIKNKNHDTIIMV